MKTEMTDIKKLNRIVKSIQILSKETDTDAYVIAEQLIGFCPAARLTDEQSMSKIIGYLESMCYH